MARPRPPAPIKPRTIRLSDTQYAAFKELGGSEWLRSRIDKMQIKNRVKAVRNRSMRIDIDKGMTYEDVAKKYGVNRTTVWRIVG